MGWKLLRVTTRKNNMSNKPQVLPWDPDAAILIIEWGIVAIFDGYYWSMSGTDEFVEHKDFQNRVQGLPWVRLLPMTTTEAEAFHRGEESAYHKVDNKLYQSIKSTTNLDETLGLKAAIRLVEAINDRD